jgi:phosphoserine aminotransferase
MARTYNFFAGPAVLPLAALERAQREMLDWAGSGTSVMETSHRGKDYEAVHNEAISLMKELIGLPDNYQVLFLQGGASQQFAVVPMNFLAPGPRRRSRKQSSSGRSTSPGAATRARPPRYRSRPS